MYDKLFEPAKKLFGIIGASATGITAVFYVFGFLVVQQHFSFLGLTHISIDFNNYLFAGGRFFAYFPVLLIHLIDMFLKYFSRYPQWFIPGFLGLIFLFLLSQIPSVRALRKRAMLRVRGHIQNKLVFYLLLTNGLFLWLFLTYSLEIVIQKNWLFKDSPSGMEWLITPSTDASGYATSRICQIVFYCHHLNNRVGIFRILTPKSKTGRGTTRRPQPSVCSCMQWALSRHTASALLASQLRHSHLFERISRCSIRTQQCYYS